METRIYNWMKKNKKPASIRRIQKSLNTSSRATNAALDSLVKKEKLVKIGSTRVALPDNLPLIDGKLKIDRNGKLIFHTENGERYPVLSTLGGRHDDIVQCYILPRRGHSPAQAIVKKIVEHAHQIVTGRYVITDRGAQVQCLDPRLGIVYVKDSTIAADGDLVSVNVTSTPVDSKLPSRGTVIEVLGDGNDAIGYLRSIAVSKGISIRFEENIIQTANQLDSISEKDLVGRDDLRNMTIFTIDGASAKDLDDAISLQVLEDGTRRLGVHIADVSHYVKPNSVLDDEGYKRGNSTYLPGLTFPMLPERLSNGLCSLLPGEDKLTLSAFIDYDKAGNVTKTRLAKSVIASSERLTYTEVQQVLDGDMSGKAAKFKDTLLIMEELRQQLKAARIANGSMDFDLPESTFILNDDGWAKEITLRSATHATQLIEEFMLAANQSVAKIADKNRLPAIFRSHPEPDGDRTMDLWAFLSTMGYGGKGCNPKEFQRVLRAVSGKPEEHVVNYAILRSMQKAVYTSQNEGHYGLAFTHYCHFTSPIRRYSDLVTHRAIKEYIDGNETGTAKDAIAKRCTDCEIASMDAEREANDLMKAKFMQSKVGDVFDGVISSVTNFGIFVELENGVEGLVHITALGDDYYIYDEKNTYITWRAQK